jgi:hypothetical protein
MIVTAGATAVGGGEITLVVVLPLVVVVLLFVFVLVLVLVLVEVESDVDLLVESVTIGSIAQAFVDKAMTKSTAVAIFLFILIPKSYVVLIIFV